MAYLLVVPEGRDFPYEAVCDWLQQQPEMDFDPKDFAKLIVLLERLDAPQAVIDEQHRLDATGRCFDFCQGADPELMGSLYPEYVRFETVDGEHDEICRPAIEAAASSFDLEIQRE